MHAAGNGAHPFTSVSQAISIVSPTPLPPSEHNMFSRILSNAQYIIVSRDSMQFALGIVAWFLFQVSWNTFSL
jgi:hypothetical protein